MGDGVNVASWIESMGMEGAVLFSREVYNKIRNLTEFKSHRLGTFDFKNVDEPMAVFAIANEGFPVPQKGTLTGKFNPAGKNKTQSSPLSLLNPVCWGIMVILLITAGILGWFIRGGKCIYGNETGKAIFYCATERQSCNPF